MPLLVLVIGKTDTHIYRNLQNIVVYKWLILFGSTPIFLIIWLDGNAVQDLFWYLGLHLGYHFFLFYLTYHVYMYYGPMNIRIVLIENTVSWED